MMAKINSDLSPCDCPLNSCKLIYVEDSDLDAQLFSLFLKRLNLPIEYMRFRDGEEAVDFFTGSSDQETLASKCLLVLDLGLPKLTGHDVLRRLRSSPPFDRLYIIIFSGSSEASDRTLCLSLAAKEYFTKPFDLDEFSKFVEGPLVAHLKVACAQDGTAV